jgi:hypothetical protein
MVDVTDGADVAVRLVPLELCFGHGRTLFLVNTVSVVDDRRLRISAAGRGGD